MRSDHELEELIDSALPEYSEAEPKPGLEQRVIARALAEEVRHKPRAWGWVLAIPAIACLLVFLFLTARHNTSPSGLRVTAKNTRTPTAADPEVTAMPALSSLHRKEPRPGRLPAQLPTPRVPLPKQDVFPTPTPPTAEEVAMIALMRRQAPIFHQVADNQAEVEIPDVHIAELEIKPVSTLAEQKLGPSATLSALTSQQP